MCKHINEHWNNEHLKRLVYNTSLYLICRLGIILTTCHRAGTVWPILRRKWKTLFGSRVNTTGFQMPRKVQYRVQTHWDHFCTRDHFSLREPTDWFLILEHHILAKTTHACAGLGNYPWQRAFSKNRAIRCVLFWVTWLLHLDLCAKMARNLKSDILTPSWSTTNRSSHKMGDDRACRWKYESIVEYRR